MSQNNYRPNHWKNANMYVGANFTLLPIRTSGRARLQKVSCYHFSGSNGPTLANGLLMSALPTRRGWGPKCRRPNARLTFTVATLRSRARCWSVQRRKKQAKSPEGFTSSVRRKPMMSWGTKGAEMRTIRGSSLSRARKPKIRTGTRTKCPTRVGRRIKGRRVRCPRVRRRNEPEPAALIEKNSFRAFLAPKLKSPQTHIVRANILNGCILLFKSFSYFLCLIICLLIVFLPMNLFNEDLPFIFPT